MEFTPTSPSLSQVDSLMAMLKSIESINDHWVLNGKTYTILSNKTYKQYKFLLALLFNRKFIKLNGVLNDWGIKRK